MGRMKQGRVVSKRWERRGVMDKRVRGRRGGESSAAYIGPQGSSKPSIELTSIASLCSWLFLGRDAVQGASREGTMRIESNHGSGPNPLLPQVSYALTRAQPLQAHNWFTQSRLIPEPPAQVLIDSREDRRTYGALWG